MATRATSAQSSPYPHYPNRTDRLANPSQKPSITDFGVADSPEASAAPIATTPSTTYCCTAALLHYSCLDSTGMFGLGLPHTASELTRLEDLIEVSTFASHRLRLICSRFKEESRTVDA